MKIDNDNRKQFYRSLTQACQTGDINFIKEVINSDQVNSITVPIPDKMLMRAAGFGHNDIIEAMLESPYLKEQICESYCLTDALERAFQFGHIKTINLLMQKLHEFDQFNQSSLRHNMDKAVERGDLNLIKHFYDKFCTEYTNGSIGREVLREACIYNKLDIVKYVIEHDNQQALDDFNSHHGFIFWTVMENKNWEIARYFIFDLNMPKTGDLESHLKSRDKEESEKINNMFNIRELNKNLNEELAHPEQIANPTKKVKI
jgi:hypothetical protein